MNITWDDAKRRRNIAKHGIDLAMAERFDFSTALIEIDLTSETGEQRERAIGWIEGAGDLHLMVFSYVGDDDIRAISLRRATKSEYRRYAYET